VFDIQPDSSIIIAGDWENDTLDSINGHYLVRLFPNGMIDTSFGSAGFVTTSLNNIEHMYEMKITSGNRILLSVRNSIPNISTVMAFDANGAIDSTYGIDGMAEIPGDSIFIGNLYHNREMLSKPNEHIVMVGQDPASYRIFTYELDENGFLEMVNNDTTAIVMSTEVLTTAILTSDDHIYLGTTNYTSGTMFMLDSLRQQDLVFANNGFLTELGNQSNYYLSSIGVQSDKKIIFAGNYAGSWTGGEVITRYYNSGLGVEEENNISFKVYPNPASQYFQISLSDPNETIEQVRIIDIAGKITYVPTNQNLPIDISFFSSGMYFVEVKTNKGRGVEKLLIR
jgi:hypothetical protein